MKKIARFHRYYFELATILNLRKGKIESITFQFIKTGNQLELSKGLKNSTIISEFIQAVILFLPINWIYDY